jgi:YD repeat-containing protein
MPGRTATLEPIIEPQLWRGDPMRSYGRKLFLFVLLLLSLACLAGILVWKDVSRRAAYRNAADAALWQLNSSEIAQRLLGTPISISHGLTGVVGPDLFGFEQGQFTIPVHGPRSNGVVHAVGANSSGPWVFATLELVTSDGTRANLVSGRVFAPNGKADLASNAPELPPATVSGKHPCVVAVLEHDDVLHTHVGECATPTGPSGGPVDRFEVDLRYGSFVLRESDLYLNDIFDVPLTRTYTSGDWVHHNHRHAFGNNTNHPFDIAPLGSRNPYTYQMIAMEDSDFQMFDRVSPGTTYGDAVYRHTETSGRFYGATTAWNGNGWTTELADGSAIVFPESYHGTNMAQGAPIAFRNAAGDKLELTRDAECNLKQITTPHGQWIRFRYDGLGRILRAEDDQRHWAKYTYGSNGMLTDVVRSDGRQRHFTYRGTNLTSVMDDRSRVLVRNFYDGNVITRQEFANGDTYRYSYDWPRGRHARAVTITLPNGTRTTVRVGGSVPAYMKHAH